jgi:hypothetical protein
MTNEELINAYPFLIPDYYKDKMDEYKEEKYPFTLLDDMPIGWKKAFGELLCQDLKEQLIKENALDKYSVMQIKEKFGELRWHDNGSKEIQDIITKYTYISKHICIITGRIDVPIFDDGWICPYSRNVFQELLDERFGKGVKNADEFMVKDANLKRDFVMRRFSKDSTTDIKYDCSDILIRMGADITKIPSFDNLKEKEDYGNVR